MNIIQTAIIKPIHSCDITKSRLWKNESWTDDKFYFHSESDTKSTTEIAKRSGLYSKCSQNLEEDGNNSENRKCREKRKGKIRKRVYRKRRQPSTDCESGPCNYKCRKTVNNTNKGIVMKSKRYQTPLSNSSATDGSFLTLGYNENHHSKMAYLKTMKFGKFKISRSTIKTRESDIKRTHGFWRTGIGLFESP